jgi:hypothetical protein
VAEETDDPAEEVPDKPPEDFGQFINALDDTLSSSRFGRRMNLGFWDDDESDHLRDFRKTFDYPDSLDVDDYRAMYERLGIAGRLVDKPAEDSWKEPPNIVEVGENVNGQTMEREDTEFTDKVQKVFDRFGLHEQLKRLDKLQRLGEYGLLFMGLKDVNSDSGQRTEPPNVFEGDEDQLDEVEDILFFQVVTQHQTDIKEHVTDTTVPEFRRPKIYSIEQDPEEPGDDTNQQEGDTVDVHWRRVIHVVENPEESEYFGRPALQRVYNRLVDYMKIPGSAAESLYQLASPRWWMKANEGSDLPSDTSDLETEWKEWVNDFRNELSTSGIESVEALGGEAVDPEPVFMTVVKAIALSKGIPLRILLGTETGERASTEDRKLWFGNKIPNRRTNHCTTNIVRPLIDRLQEYGILPDVDYRVKWPALFEPTPQERAEIAAQRAKAVKQLAPMQDTEAVAPMRILRRDVLQFLPDEIDPDEDPNANFMQAENEALAAHIEQEYEEAINASNGKS